MFLCEQVSCTGLSLSGVQPLAEREWEEGYRNRRRAVLAHSTCRLAGDLRQTVDFDPSGSDDPLFHW